jgi:hypothetical protein
VRGYLEVVAKKDFVVGMQVWNFADFAAVQGINRMGGLNLKGVFTRMRSRSWWHRSCVSSGRSRPLVKRLLKNMCPEP